MVPGERAPFHRVGYFNAGSDWCDDRAAAAVGNRDSQQMALTSRKSRPGDGMAGFSINIRATKHLDDEEHIINGQEAQHQVDTVKKMSGWSDPL